MTEVNNAEFTLQQQTVLSLLEKHADYINGALDILDGKAQENINISSIIIAIVGAFSLSASTGATPSLDTTNLICVFGVYCLVFALSFSARHPQNVDTYPMQPTYDNANRWAAMDTQTMFSNLTSTYADIIETNSKLMYRKAKLIRYGTFFIVVDIAIIIAGLVIQ